VKFRRRLCKPLALAIAVSHAMPAFANPVNPTIVQGTASFAANGSALTVTNSANAIINWQAFSIGKGELTRFVQPSAASAVLNRITGQDPSQILGQLQSNGKVLLINPNGILFGKDARVDVAGLVASTLNLSNDDFLAGRYRFAGDGINGVVNQGTISTPMGGSVYLIGGSTRNEGLITSPKGEVILAAGQTVDLVDSATPNVKVEIVAPAGEAVNLGSIFAGGGSIDIHAATVNQQGIVNADALARDDQGHIRLIASERVMLAPGSVTSASNAAGGTGGSVEIAARVAMLDGEIHADGTAGGSVRVTAENLQQSSATTVDGSGGPGGRIDLAADRVVQTSSALLSANGAGDQGGSISVLGRTIATGDPGTEGRIFSSAAYSVTGDTGGRIALSAHDVLLLGASLDAGGLQAGGQILVGGGFQGADPTLPNATSTLVNYSSVLKADATQNGNGGSIVVWSDASTGFAGSTSARGGLQGGNGGSLEISSKDTLVYAGTVDAGAPRGDAGRLLLDPKNITMDASAVAGLSSFQLVDPHPGASQQYGSKVLVLSNDNVVVTDPFDNFGGSQAGAVYLFNGHTGALISSITGDLASDRVGNNSSTSSLIALPSGNFLINSGNWHTSAGAVTFASGTTGVSGVVSAANSLVGSTAFNTVGQGLSVLPSGNYVVRSPTWNGLMGAVTWGSGTLGVSGLVSSANSLVGSTAGDLVGQGTGVNPLTILPNGNYVVASPSWSNGATSGVGAVTWVNGTNGNIAGSGSPGGAVSSANSLVGSAANENVGSNLSGGTFGSVMAGWGVNVLANGNYVVNNPRGAGFRGAVTWGDGTNGDLAGSASPGGVVSAANSLVGGTVGDAVGSNGISILPNGNYVVISPSWIGLGGLPAGAVSLGNGATGTVGTVSAANSLIGGNLCIGGCGGTGDRIGSDGITVLANGNFVVNSKSFTPTTYGIDGQGAINWVSGTTGATGTVDITNSLWGTNSTNGPGSTVTALPNGNYVVISTQARDNAGGVSAATLGSGTGGTVGHVSHLTNSLMGAANNDIGGVTVLSNGNYVVQSPNWNGGMGAATFGSGTTGVLGLISSSNSLVGGVAGDTVGNRVTALVNGNYVTDSIFWNSNRGAVTFGNGTTGITGAVSAANSLVGTSANDLVGTVVALPSGNYVVASPNWSGNTGAITFGNGSSGIAGTISAANSLVGSTPGDRLGIASSAIAVKVLPSGNYVVSSSSWNNNRGAVTWGSGATGLVGVVSAANSLVGNSVGDGVGSTLTGAAAVRVLANGDYVVTSDQWSNTNAVETGGPVATSAGAVTYGSGTSGVSAVVSSATSLVGTHSNDLVGMQSSTYVPIYAGPTGSFAVDAPTWNGNRGAVSLLGGAAQFTGTVAASNSFLGTVAGGQIGIGGVAPLSNGSYAVSSFLAAGAAGQVHILSSGTVSPATGQTFAANASSPATITPSSITAITNTGTSLVLQANNDITLTAASPITTSAGGAGGNLTMQAGRSIVLNSSITTDNGGLTLVANETLANGVVDAQRDPGAAVITQAAATTLNTGTGTLAVTLKNGAGKTNLTSGAISLTNVTAATANIANQGTTAGSGVTLAGTMNVGSLTANAANGAIALSAGTAINASGAGSAVVLAGTSFNNAVGSSVFNLTGGGRWLVWSGDPTVDVRGGLGYNFKQYGAIFGSTAVASATGNGFLYTLAPMLTPGLTGTVTKVADGNTVATLAPANYTLSGMVDGDTAALNNPSLGSYDTPLAGTGKTVTASGLAIAGASNGVATVYGYQLAAITVSSAIGTITAPPAPPAPPASVPPPSAPGPSSSGSTASSTASTLDRLPDLVVQSLNQATNYASVTSGGPLALDPDNAADRPTVIEPVLDILGSCGR
jgi:filamentous hemagglutinin family protein